MAYRIELKKSALKSLKKLKESPPKLTRWLKIRVRKAQKNCQGK